ncbi:UNVERIFIED_CONTAM: hypothetical protein GTU68_036634 [Idotea baltica]|nr:hypothetical protein [Idotea baltica]
MLRQQGTATMMKAQQRMQSGEMPAQQMLEGLLLVIGGVLLLTPGFITDIFGFCTLVPMSRQFLANKLASGAMSNMNVFVGGAKVNSAGGGPSRPNPRPGGTPGVQSGPQARPGKSAGSDPDVIEGDYRHLD